MPSNSKAYDAASLSVLKGLEPVRVHPGMYTDTRNPNHLAQEVIDNSVDEALAEHASQIHITWLDGGGLCVEDDGRGMPTDIHPEQGLSGVELILTQLHAGGKFSNQNYTYSGGLHGVGISVVNALSSRLTVEVKRQGKRYQMSFESGQKQSDLIVLGDVSKQETGTRVTFYPDPQFFDAPTFDRAQLIQVLKAKAVLCPGLTIYLHEGDHTQHWCYPLGIATYFESLLNELQVAPKSGWLGSDEADEFAVQWAVAWRLDGTPSVNESYVNLVPTAQGGTHVNGLKAGVCEAIRQFAETHDRLPRGLKLKPEDIFSRVNYILSVKVLKPQFFGQTKERLMNKGVTPYVSKVVEHALSLWLNQHMQTAEVLVDLCVELALNRLKQAKKVVRKNRIILVGSSMGAWISLNQFKFFKKQIVGFLGIGSAPQFLEGLMWNKFSRKMKKEITKNGIINLKHGKYEYPISMQLIKDGRKNKVFYKKIYYKLKVTMVHGQKDESVPVSYSKKILKIFVNSKKRLIVVKNGDHSLSSPKWLSILEKELKIIIN